MPCRRVPILALAVFIAGAFLTPASSGAAHLESARFHATLSASQATTWTINNDTGCAVQTGSGSQRLTFHQAKKLTLIFTRQVGGTRLLNVRLAGKPGDIPIAGEINRQGQVVTTHPPKCTVVGRPEGPPVAPPAPDCGSKRFTGTVRPTWSTPDLYPTLPGELPPLAPLLWIDEPYIPVAFNVCPYYGPLIAFRLTHVGLKESKVFGPKPKLVLSDEETKVSQPSETAQGVLSETKVGWTMKLTRVTRRPRSPR